MNDISTVNSTGTGFPFFVAGVKSQLFRALIASSSRLGQRALTTRTPVIDASASTTLQDDYTLDLFSIAVAGVGRLHLLEDHRGHDAIAGPKLADDPGA